MKCTKIGFKCTKKTFYTGSQPRTNNLNRKSKVNIMNARTRTTIIFNKQINNVKKSDFNPNRLLAILYISICKQKQKPLKRLKIALKQMLNYFIQINKF